MTRRPLHRSALLALALLLGLTAGLAACGDDDGGGSSGSNPDDISRSEFEDRLLRSGMPDGTASCVVDRVFQELDQDEINTVVRTPSNEAAGKDLVDAYSTIVGDCTREGVEEGIEDRGVTTTAGDGTGTTAATETTAAGG